MSKNIKQDKQQQVVLVEKSQEQVFKESLAQYDNKYNTLVDYFALIGISNTDLKQAIQCVEQDKTMKFIPQVLSRVPEIDKPNIAFPNQVPEVNLLTHINQIQFCFPDQIRIMQEEQIKYQELVLTSADGQSIYVVTMIINEDLSLIQNAILKYHHHYKHELSGQKDEKKSSHKKSSTKSKSPRQLILHEKKKSFCKTPMSRLDYVEEDKIMHGIAGDFSKAVRKNSTNKQSQDDLMSNGQQSDDRQHTIEEECKSIELNKIETKQYYLPKALCLLSRYPFFEQFKYILQDIQQSCFYGLGAPLEDYLAHLVYSVPAPPRGRAKIILQLQQKQKCLENMVFELPPINQLPYANYEFIRVLFDSLDVDNILLFLKRVLLDSNNLMVSNDRNKLVQVGEAMKSLVYPFKFEFIYVPYLPSSLTDYLNAPMPYLMGVEENLMEEAEDNINDGTYIINLDHNRIDPKAYSSINLSSLCKFKPLMKDELPDLPYHYTKKLQQSLQQIVKTKLKKNQRLTDKDIDGIRDQFFQFFVGVFQDLFEKDNWYLNQNIKSNAEGATAYFNLNRFLETTQKDQQVFLKLFCKLQMFNRLLERKLYPTKSEDLTDLTFFEENIKLKLNRAIRNAKKKFDTPFLLDESQKSQMSFQCNILNDLKKQATQDLIKSIYHDSELVPFLIESGQSLQEFTYIYQVLPQKLDQKYLQDVFLKECYNKNTPFKSFQEQQLFQQMSINKVEQVNKKQRAQLAFDDEPMEVNVFISWILIWAATLTYQDKREFKFRQKQLNEVLGKLSQKCHKLNLEIFELLMDTALKYGTLQMVLEIFYILEEFRLKPNAAIMTAMLTAISRNNMTMEEVHKLNKRRKENKTAMPRQQDLRQKLDNEIKRRENIQKQKRGPENESYFLSNIFDFRFLGLFQQQPYKSEQEVLEQQQLQLQQQLQQAQQEEQKKNPLPTTPRQTIKSIEQNEKSEQKQLHQNQESQIKNHQIKRKKISYLDSKSQFYKEICSKFRSRTFLKPEEYQEFSSDKVTILIKEVCQRCNTVNYPKDILKSTLNDKENLNLYIFRCKCYEPIQPNLKIRIGDMNKFKNDGTPFLYPQQLRLYVEDRMHLDNQYRNGEQIQPDILKEYNKNIYWNLIWYFAEFDLPYDFLVPYEDESLFEEFLDVNSHLKSRNKLRLENLVKREGGVDLYIQYVEKEIKLQANRLSASLNQKKKKRNYTRLSSVKKEEKKRQTLAQGNKRQSLNRKSYQFSKRSKSEKKKVLEKL